MHDEPQQSHHHQRRIGFDPLETLFDHNTLYAPYKPNSSVPPGTSAQLTLNGNEPNLISTSSASSTSTASCSSSSSSSSYLPAPVNSESIRQTKPFFAQNRRESLFYHSTDNYRYNLPQQQQQYFCNEPQQQPQRANQINYGNKIAPASKVVMHSTPVNVSNQVQSVSDMFDEELGGLKEKTYFLNQFQRYNRNQLSTKSQPPMPTEQTFGESANKIIEDEYFHRTFKANFNSNYQNAKFNLNMQPPVILPHPAQV